MMNIAMFTVLKYDHDLISTIKLNNENNATHATYFIQDQFLVPFFLFFSFYKCQQFQDFAKLKDMTTMPPLCLSECKHL